MFFSMAFSDNPVELDSSGCGKSFSSVCIVGSDVASLVFIGVVLLVVDKWTPVSLRPTASSGNDCGSEHPSTADASQQ
jgi:hypothetical protein